jgi:predicted glycosyltransferase involved in capsule biosynthesis
MNKVTVVIPWRAVPSRIPAFEKVIDFYKKNFPDFEVIPSDSDGEIYNLSRSRNLGAKKAIERGAEIIIFNDADSFAKPELIRKATEYSLENNEIVAPYNKTHQHYDAEETSLFFEEFNYELPIGEIVCAPQPPSQGEEPVKWHPCSGVLIVPKNIFLELDGYEERIEGWGPEDAVFHKKYFNLYGKLFHYLEGDYHSTFNDPSYRIINPDHSKYLYGLL